MEDPEEIGRQKLSEYEFVRNLGSGAFADVKLYKHRVSQRLYAIKSVRRVAHHHGINLGAVKELAAFNEIGGHPNILSVHDAFSFAGQTHIVLEYCLSDLTAIARDRSVKLSEADVKSFALQLFDGLAAVHAARFVHADLKPDNVLIAPDGVLKLADFGHSAPVALGGDNTGGGLLGGFRPRFHRIVTVWYRAPELLAGARVYGPAVDMWAAGCILAELFLRCPLFPAQGGPNTREEDWEQLQMAAIQRLLGTPIDPLAAKPESAQAQAAPHSFRFSERSGSAASEVRGVWTSAAGRSEQGRGKALHSGTQSATARQQWPGCTSLPSYPEFEPRQAQPWSMILPPGAVPSGALDLISHLLLYDPTARWTAAQAMQHPWFAAEPTPTPPSKVPLHKSAAAALAGVRA